LWQILMLTANSFANLSEMCELSTNALNWLVYSEKNILTMKIFTWFLCICMSLVLDLLYSAFLQQTGFLVLMSFTLKMKWSIVSVMVCIFYVIFCMLSVNTLNCLLHWKRDMFSSLYLYCIFPCIMLCKHRDCSVDFHPTNEMYTNCWFVCQNISNAGIQCHCMEYKYIFVWCWSPCISISISNCIVSPCTDYENNSYH